MGQADKGTEPPVLATGGPGGALPAALAQAIVSRLRRQEASLCAVLLAGSYARGEADAFSDVDIMALTEGPPRHDERGWLEPEPLSGRYVHVSVELESVGSYLAHTPEPASWSLGFPVVDAQLCLWATDEARTALGEDASLSYPAAEPSLEDCVELYRKVRRAASKQDSIGLRVAARMLGEHAPALLRDFNPSRAVRSPREAVMAALSLEAGPEGYRDDLMTCLALRAATDTEIVTAADRLASGLFRFLKSRLHARPFRPDDIRSALLDGSLEAFAIGNVS